MTHLENVIDSIRHQMETKSGSVSKTVVDTWLSNLLKVVDFERCRDLLKLSKPNLINQLHTLTIKARTIHRALRVPTKSELNKKSKEDLVEELYFLERHWNTWS